MLIDGNWHINIETDLEVWSGESLKCNPDDESIGAAAWDGIMVRERGMSVEKLLKRAIKKHESAEYLEAVKLYKKVLAENPRHLDANYLLGTLYAERGSLDKAKYYLAIACEVNPNSALVLVNLGNVYRQQGQCGLAVTAFTRARQLMPKLYQAHLGLGSSLVELGQDLETADDCLQKALALAPEEPEIIHQIGLLSWLCGSAEDALQVLELARKLNPKMPGIDLDLGRIYLLEEQNDQAAERFREACRQNPGDAKAHYFLEIAEGKTSGRDLLQRFPRQETNRFTALFEERLVEKLG